MEENGSSVILYEIIDFHWVVLFHYSYCLMGRVQAFTDATRSTTRSESSESRSVQNFHSKFEPSFENQA